MVDRTTFEDGTIVRRMRHSIVIPSGFTSLARCLLQSIPAFQPTRLPAPGDPAYFSFNPLYSLKGKETNSGLPLSHEHEHGKKSEPDEDWQLVLACREGDTGAFEQLIRKYQTRMINISFRMTGDYDDACEAVQEAFLSAYRSIRKFRGDAKFSTWLYGICINHSKNRLSQARRRSRHEVQSVDQLSSDSQVTPASEPSDPGPSALDRIEKKELQAKVQECIDSLEEQQRVVVVLRDIEGFSYEEIVDILGLPDGTIKSRLFRARENLRKSLKRVIGDY
jgi:RNA polymerase sigma-70 factor, ECF subfamily